MVIHNGRNQVRIIPGPDGKEYVIKRYHQPPWFNRIVYTFIRQPKAVRAYNNALLLTKNGIETPLPIAYILEKNGLLKESYLITERCTYPNLLYVWGDEVTEGREDAMRAFGRFTGKMHNIGALHLDYSPGNILYRRNGDDTVFSIVDINRMRWGQISVKQGCRNLARLWGDKPMYRFIAQGYAQERHSQEDQCLQWMWEAHQRFWKHRAKPIRYGTFKEV
ncbi:MAG: lipopolysaccharide kinase InaA family protein [Paludibacteraceae bacterium]|nr:lipopolysaccharide kinase InaA family protein [Paludibacteraceae bacterium]